MQLKVARIGQIAAKPGFAVQLDREWRAGLLGLEGFGHVVVLWVANKAEWSDALIRVPKPYVGGPKEVGIFATRSSVRPSGICLSVAGIAGVEPETGRVNLTWIDADDGSPVIDIKPYHPSADRVENPSVLPWCAAWPRSLEQSARFDWSTVFNFA